MRLVPWTFAAVLVAGGLALALAETAPSARAADDDAEAAKIAKEELDKAVARGKELFSSRDLGKKACVECHEDPDKPEDDLRNYSWSYPKYSRRARRVVTLHQKINEMLKYKARGQELEADSADIAALAAYVESIRKR